jgi:hypothetical protein
MCRQVFCGACSVVADKKTVMSRFKIELSCLPCKKQKRVEECVPARDVQGNDFSEGPRVLTRALTGRRAKRVWTCCASGARNSDKRTAAPTT